MSLLSVNFSLHSRMFSPTFPSPELMEHTSENLRLYGIILEWFCSAKRMELHAHSDHIANVACRKTPPRSHLASHFPTEVLYGTWQWLRFDN